MDVSEFDLIIQTVREYVTRAAAFDAGTDPREGPSVVKLYCSEIQKLIIARQMLGRVSARPVGG